MTRSEEGIWAKSPRRSAPCRARTRKFGREFSRFGFPIKHQRRRADDQRGSAAPRRALFDSAQMGQHLGGFAQPHFVGQNAAEAVAGAESRSHPTPSF